jgi:GT2 family glycosyltransferase
MSTEDQRKDERKVFSVVVPLFNNRKTIRKTVQSLLACKPIAEEIIIVDDGSTDQGPDEIANLPVTLLRNGHKGRPAALNSGIAKASGKWILFTDADCIVREDWVSTYQQAIRTSGRVGIGGNLIPSRWTLVETAKILRYVEEFQQTIDLSGQYSGVCLNGNNMAIRKDAIDRTGGFDEEYFHGADADITRRLLEAGFQLKRVPEIVTTHLKVDDLRSYFRTCYLRGSTVRFQAGQKPYSLRDAIRSFLVTPFKNLVNDLRRVPILCGLNIYPKGRLTAYAAAWIGFAGDWVNAVGRLAYLRANPGGGS